MQNIFEKNIDSLDFSEYLQTAENELNRLFPLNRSILNEGVLSSLNILKENVDFEIIDIKSGFKCYDWEVPKEWVIYEAFIELDGKKIIDFKNCNLHVLNYSDSIDEELNFEELEKNLYYLKDLPDAIPYKTSYYKKNWGFCLTYNQFLKLDRNAKYRVKIDSKFIDGTLRIAEKVVKGKVKDEILISAYTCHPSMANDSLSGVIIWSLILKILQFQKPYFTYRLVLVPETIGAIAYLRYRENEIKKFTKRGFVLTTCGGPGKFGFKNSFLGDDIIDISVKFAFRDSNVEYISYPFDINGSDERQYSSPFFRIPCSTITKDKYYEYKEYHTSLDNLSFVKINYLKDTFVLYLKAIQNLELGNKKFISKNTACEPFLTKRDLYSSLGVTINNLQIEGEHHQKKEYTTNENQKITGEDIDTILWLMFYCDGNRNLFEISSQTNLPLYNLNKMANLLISLDLISEI